MTSKSTQQFVPIKEIRDGVAVLNDGSLRIVLMVSTLNFALKSEDEQQAIVMQYQSFLNSLDFTVQFYIQSRKLDINPYLGLLNEAEKEQTNELLKIQIKEYIDFVKDLVKITNVVAKSFYVIIPYTTSFSRSKGEGFLFGLFGKKKNETEEETQFEEAKIQLQQRVDVVQQGLARSGIRAVPLETEELIELFYKLFNPGEIEKELKS